MKHGPIALIDEDMPVVVISPKGSRYDKTASNSRKSWPARVGSSA